MNGTTSNGMGTASSHPIHIGILIKQRLEEIGMTKAEFGRRINTSRQNVNSLLHKHSLDTELLGRISLALGHNFFNYYADTSAPEAPKTGHLDGMDISAKVLAASLEVQAAIARLNMLLMGGS